MPILRLKIRQFLNEHRLHISAFAFCAATFLLYQNCSSGFRIDPNINPSDHISAASSSSGGSTSTGTSSTGTSSTGTSSTGTSSTGTSSTGTSSTGSPNTNPGGSGTLAAVTPPTPTSGNILKVGPGQTYLTLASAVSAAHSGDTIQLAPGTYTDDIPSEISINLTIEAIGGFAHLLATQAISNGKGILILGASGTTINLYNLEISGAKVSEADGANGAGIRYQGGALNIYSSYIHDNQNGLMGGSSTPGAGSITINNSEFAFNGVTDTNSAGYGYTHNLYASTGIASVTATNSYFFAANIGHDFKSRAMSTTIKNCFIADGSNGTASYNIDIPDGGNVDIENNVIEKGPSAQNTKMLTIGEESSSNSTTSIVISGNIFINDGTAGSAVSNSTSFSASLSNNKVFGLTSSQVLSGAGTESGDSVLSTSPYAVGSWTSTFP